MLIAHRVALDPTNRQRTCFTRAAGAAQFARNRTRAKWQRQYAARQEDPALPPPSDASVRRQLNGLKRAQFPWMFDVTKCTAHEAIIDLGTARNRRLARSIMDGGLYEFRRQLACKAKFHGATLVVADRWFPSSKSCSCCGSVKTELALSQRHYQCDARSFEASRDLNAAINLERLAASSAVSACGEECSGARHKPRVKRKCGGTGLEFSEAKRAPAKQEPDSKRAAQLSSAVQGFV